MYCDRPTSQSGRPLSGFARPGTQSARPGTMEQALRTPRTAHTARPVTATSGRYVRLGTVSMVYLIVGLDVFISFCLMCFLFVFVFTCLPNVSCRVQLTAFAIHQLSLLAC